MNQLRILFILTLSVIPFLQLSAQAATDKEKLETYLQAEMLDSDIEIGEELYNVFGDHESLLIKLGNAYYNLGDLGHARWCFERALFFNPRSEVAKHNINVSREALLEIEEEPFLLDVFKRNLFFILPGNSWAILSFIFGCTGLVLFYLRKNGSKIKRWPFVVSYSLLLVSLFIAIGKAKHLSSSDRFIVMNNSSTLKESPEDRSAIITSLTSGNLIFRKDAIGDWLEVEMTNGTRGWVEKKNLKGVRDDK